MRKTTGISLLLLIFLSLCLITFSLLSLSGAVADEKLSQKAADHTTEYYVAVSKANEILAFLDSSLLQTVSPSAAADPITRDTIDSFSDIHMGSEFEGMLSTKFTDSAFFFEQTEEKTTVTFTVPVTDDSSQILEVILELHIPETSEQAEISDENFYEIISWQIRNISQWNPDHSQNLMRISESTS